MYMDETGEEALNLDEQDNVETSVTIAGPSLSPRPAVTTRGLTATTDAHDSIYHLDQPQPRKRRTKCARCRILGTRVRLCLHTRWELIMADFAFSVRLKTETTLQDVTAAYL
jgi:hypothetical protein